MALAMALEMETLGLWLGFTVFVLAMLALDLGVFNRTAHVVSYREAALWSGIWIGLALAAVLVVVGVKMLIADLYHVPIGLSLGVIALILTVAIVASVVRGRGAEATGEARPTPVPTRADTAEQVERVEQVD